MVKVVNFMLLAFYHPRKKIGKKMCTSTLWANRRHQVVSGLLANRAQTEPQVYLPLTPEFYFEFLFIQLTYSSLDGSPFKKFFY